MIKKALITGISGQDGSYLANFLLKKNYIIFGITRNKKKSNLKNLYTLNIKNSCKIFQCNLDDINATRRLIKKIKPDEIYHLSGISSVAKSFKYPAATYISIVNSTINILESIHDIKADIKFFSACSSECYGNTGKKLVDETSGFNPLSPYAVAKTSAFYIVKNYREAYNIFAVSGILFSHESPIRSKSFVTQKIISNVIDIYNKKRKFLELGSIDIQRDWGWSPEYVEAMYLIIQQKNPSDFVIASGKSYPLKDFIKLAFEYFDLNWKDHVKINKKLKRPLDIICNKGNTKKAKKILKWKSTYNLKKIVHEMIENKFRNLNL